MFTFNFEKLDVWQDAIDFANLIYKITKDFPDHERFGLTSQMRRAVVSISSNIAEGSSRASRADFARYIEIAAGSVFELVSQAKICLDQQFISDLQYQQIASVAEKQCRMLSGLRRSLSRQ